MPFDMDWTLADLAAEDSVTGTLAAELAGCPALVVPNDVVAPAGPADGTSTR